MKRHAITLWAFVLAAAPPVAGDDKGIHITGGQQQSLNWTCRDGAGYDWDITQQGLVNDGTNDAYDGGMRLNVNGNTWNFGGPATLSRDGREIEMGPWTTGSVQVWRRIYVDGETGYCRWIDIFQNTAGGDQDVSLEYYSNMGASTQYTLTTAGKADLAESDWGIVTSDASSGSSRPAIVHVFGSKRAKNKPTFIWTRNSDNLYYRTVLKVPANTTVALCLIEAQRRPTAEAEKFLRTFRTEAELRKVPLALRRILVNMGSSTAVWGTLELPRSSEHDTVIKTNGDEMLGTIQNANYVLQDTCCGNVELPAQRVVGLSVADPTGQYVLMALTDGEVLAGKLLSGPVQLKMADGNTIELPAKSISTAAYKVSPERPEEVAARKPMMATRSGQRLSFRDADFACTFHTEYGDLKLNPADLREILLDTPDGGLHRAVFRNGSVLSGLIVNENLKVRLDVGKTVTIRQQAVERIGFVADEGAQARPLSELKLRNEDILRGDVVDPTLVIETPHGRVTVNAGDIAEIGFASSGSLSAVQIKRQDGSKISGRLVGDTIRFQIIPGPVLPVFAGHIVSVTCPQGTPREPTTKPATNPPPATPPATPGSGGGSPVVPGGQPPVGPPGRIVPGGSAPVPAAPVAGSPARTDKVTAVNVFCPRCRAWFQATPAQTNVAMTCPKCGRVAIPAR